MSQIEDMEVINRYVSGTVVPTGKAEAYNLQRSWNSWYSGLGWFDKNLSANILETARTKRKAFNVALGTPELPGGITNAQLQSGELKNPAKSVNVTNMTPAQREAAVWNKPAPAQSGSSLANAMSWPKTGNPPILILGVKNPPWVKEWQRIIGMPQTGIYDTNMVQATKAWQSSHGMTGQAIDGKVGPKTWGMAKGLVGVMPQEVSIIDSLKEGLNQAVQAVTGKPAQTAAPTTSSGARPPMAAAPKPAAQAAAGPKPVQGTTAAALTPSVVQAGMFGNLAGLTTTQKVVGVVLTVVAMVLGSKAVMDHKPARHASR
jgi:peptidoglycan hydrolase-like protein with peptidoglycan-binding domain